MDHPLLYWDYPTCEADCSLRLLVGFWKQRPERVRYLHSLNEGIPHGIRLLMRSVTTYTATNSVGINLSFYDLHSLDHVTMIDLSEGMLSRAKAKAATLQTGQQIDFVSGDVQDLPFRDSTFDTVTDTFSFCVFPSPQAAMNEMARVLKPGERFSCATCMSASAARVPNASC